MSDLVALFRTFVRVVEAGSFTAVAQELNTSQPTISRQIAALEDQLGALLFQRTTRALTLTDDGRVLYEQARQALDSVQQALGSVGRRRGAPSGTLRLACPVVFGRLHIVPRLDAFLSRYPEVSIDLIMNDGFTDLIEEGIDLAVRIGDITDPSLIARRIGMTRRVTVASPAYLAARGEPSQPANLAHHECIVYSRLATGNRWEFSGENGPVSVAVSGRYRVNNSEGVREGVLGGLGIGVVPVWHFTDEIASGRLVVILSAFEPRALPTQVVYPSRRFLAIKVRAMIDFLAHEFELDPKLSAYGDRD
ncbi:LysR substrate-binding domain-containing protein [Bosea sp. R86505]|uniref:LysR family transcriptional regulator n=1 Tax=Bosea sp. R86505 TaxID=3101710 RepID=UPI0036709569